MDPDPNWAKIQGPDLNSMLLDPEHWNIGGLLIYVRKFCFSEESQVAGDCYGEKMGGIPVFDSLFVV